MCNRGLIKGRLCNGEWEIRGLSIHHILVSILRGFKINLMPSLMSYVCCSALTFQSTPQMFWPSRVRRRIVLFWSSCGLWASSTILCGWGCNSAKTVRIRNGRCYQMSTVPWNAFGLNSDLCFQLTLWPGWMVHLWTTTTGRANLQTPSCWLQIPVLPPRQLMACGTCHNAPSGLASSAKLLHRVSWGPSA